MDPHILCGDGIRKTRYVSSDHAGARSANRTDPRVMPQYGLLLLLPLGRKMSSQDVWISPYCLMSRLDNLREHTSTVFKVMF